MKKIFTITLTIVLFLSFATAASAVSYSPEEDFTITADGAVSYIGNDAVVSIPPEISGIKVTAIDSYGFYGNENVVRVTVPDTVTHLYDSAFEYCTNLSSLELPMSIEYIGKYVIDYSKIQTDFDDSDKIGYLQVGSCIFDSNYYNADDNYENEIVVKIGNDVSAIGPGAFDTYHCLSFEMGKNIKFIASDAFNDMITGKRIVDSVVYSGKYALYSYHSQPNGVLSKGAEHIEIKPGTEYLPDYLFEDNSAYTSNYLIKSISFPKSLKKISSGLLSEAVNLTNVKWHDDIEEIGSSAFYGTALSELVFPYNLKVIGSQAFGYSKVTKLYFFGNIEKIERNAFFGTNSLTDIYYTGSQEEWENVIGSYPGYSENVTIHYNCNPADYYSSSTLPENINKVTLIGGGTAIGRFFVRDLMGMPAKNCGVKYTVDGKDAKFVFTDDEGFLVVEIEHVSETQDFEIEISSLVTPIQKEILSVTVKPGEFTSSYEAFFTKGLSLGLSAGVGGKLGPVELKATMLELGVEGSIGSGLTFEQEYKDGKSKVSLTTKIDGTLAANAKLGLFADAKLSKATTLSASAIDFGVKPGIGASAGATFTIDDFDINDQEDKNALAKALLASILQANGTNVIAMNLLSKLDVKPDSYELGTTVFVNGSSNVGLIGMTGEDYVGEANVTLYGVNGKAVWDGNTKYLSNGNTAYESSFTNGSGNKVLEFELKTKGDDTKLKGGSAFKATEKSANNVKITAVHNEYEHLQELSFTAKESEEEGVLWGVDTKETSYTVKYPFESASGVSTLNTYLSDFSRGNHPILNSDQWQEVADCMLTNPKRAEYTTAVATKKGLDIDLGIGAEAGVKIGVDFGISGIETLKHDVETGFMENGDIYIQGYNNIIYDLDKRIKIEDIAASSKDIMASLLETLFETASEVVEEKIEMLKATLQPIGNSIKGKVASISTPTDNISSKAVLLFSDEFEDESSVSEVTTIGNPYVISVEDCGEILAKLTLAYEDYELSDTSEENLTIAYWDEEKCVYVKVDSEVDTENNKVSATITKQGQYIILVDINAPTLNYYVSKNDTFSPELVCLITDVSGIADFALRINDETVVNMNNFKDYYDYRTGVFRYTLEGFEEGGYFAEIYAKDSVGNSITEYADMYVSTYTVVPESIIVPEKIVKGSEFKITGNDLYNCKIYLCAKAVGKDGTEFLKSFPAEQQYDQDYVYYIAKLEGIPAGLVTDIWAECYTYSGNCSKSEVITVKTAPVELVFDEVLNGCVTVMCNNPAGLENTAKIYAVSYDKNGIMLGMQSADACGEIMFTKLPSGATVKAFLWEGLTPLCENAISVE